MDALNREGISKEISQYKFIKNIFYIIFHKFIVTEVRRIEWTEIKLTKYEYTQVFVAMRYSDLNGKIKNIDHIQYRFIGHISGRHKNDIFFSVTESNEKQNINEEYTIKLSVVEKKLYIQSIKNSLRVQLFFDLIINNIKEILVNNICYSVKIKHRPRRINEVVARYIYNDRKIDFTTNGNFIGITDNTKPTGFESISIHYTEDYEYAYVTISNKKPSMVNRFQKLLLNKLVLRLNNE